MRWLRHWLVQGWHTHTATKQPAVFSPPSPKAGTYGASLTPPKPQSSVTPSGTIPAAPPAIKPALSMTVCSHEERNLTDE